MPTSGAAATTSHLNADTPNKRSRMTPPVPSTSSIHNNDDNVNGPKTVRTFSRTITAGVPNHELRLDLSKNNITRLPRELFALTKLTVLLLRASISLVIQSASTFPRLSCCCCNSLTHAHG
jgi:Leucine-rich repeat (LRR) protein